jgi:thiol-disulfide isomerase/thioredoxin
MQRYTRKQRRQGVTRKNVNPGVVTIGLIYANWCGHCQALKPEWQKMKNNIMKTPTYKKGGYKFHEIEDADELKDSKINNINSKLKGGKLSANGYPTIFKINGGKLQYFEGGRSAGELQNWFLGKETHIDVKARAPTPFLNRLFGGKKNKTQKKRKN